MTPERRLAGLAQAAPAARERLADAILAAGAGIEVVRGPEVATAVVRLPLPGSEGSFVAGRTVLTVCEIALDGARGDGIVQGRALSGALAAAICDAEAERGGPHAMAVADLVFDAEQTRAARIAEEAAAVRATRLDGEKAA